MHVNRYTSVIAKEESTNCGNKLEAIMSNATDDEGWRGGGWEKTARVISYRQEQRGQAGPSVVLVALEFVSCLLVA